MGTLFYGDARRAIEIEDRALAHLKLVIINKLRRSEPFAFSWVTSPELGAGRHTVWVHPAIALEFRFEDSTPPALNRDWIEALSVEASSAAGLTLLAEPVATH